MTQEGSRLDLAKFTTGSLRREMERHGETSFTPVSEASEQVLLRALREHHDYGALYPGRVDSVSARWLDVAAGHYARGEIADALHYLERALPADFAGLAQLASTLAPRAAA